jgi:hypothetical protein
MMLHSLPLESETRLVKYSLPKKAIEELEESNAKTIPIVQEIKSTRRNGSC